MRPTVTDLQRLEDALAARGLRPGDLMRELRREKATRGRFLHELTAEQVHEQIRIAEGR